MIRRCLLPFLIAVALGAQEPSTMGVQIRASAPSENLKDSVGGKLGFGASLGVESDFEGGWKGRLILGYDAWGPGSAADQSGYRGKAGVSHLSAEAVRMLGPEGAKGFSGPFVFLGVGAYGWNITQTDPAYGISLTHRVIHVGGSAGFGYRIGTQVDLELRVSASRVDPQFMASFLSLGVTYRF
jgi:Outer membrane protein beta-barrel domain